jgi:hypothetical protein
LLNLIRESYRKVKADTLNEAHTQSNSDYLDEK